MRHWVTCVFQTTPWRLSAVVRVLKKSDSRSKYCFTLSSCMMTWFQLILHLMVHQFFFPFTSDSLCVYLSDSLSKAFLCLSNLTVRLSVSPLVCSHVYCLSVRLFVYRPYCRCAFLSGWLSDWLTVCLAVTCLSPCTFCLSAVSLSIRLPPYFNAW